MSVVTNVDMNDEGIDFVEDVDFPTDAHVTNSVVPNAEHFVGMAKLLRHMH